MDDQGKKYDIIASGFLKIRDSFNTEKKYLDLVLDQLKEKLHILDVGWGSGYPVASYLMGNGHLRLLQRHPEKVRSFFRTEGTRYAA